MEVFDGNLDHYDPRNPYAGDEKLPVVFFMGASRQDAESEREGRPIYRDEDYIRIYVNKDEIIERPVQERDKRRWPRQFAAWKATGANEPGMMGTPLSKFAMVTRAQVEELRYFKIFTVEQLAEIPDTTAQQIPGVMKLKQQAQAHILIAREQAPLQHLNEELASRDVKIAQQDEKIEELLRQVTELREQRPPAAEQRARR